MLKKMFVLAVIGFVPYMVRAESSDWVYMDLGEVIVTGDDTNGFDFIPGALNLLAELNTAGYRVALISNIPESWGARCSEKFNSLKTYLDSNMNGPQTLDWTIFDKIILPPFDRYRKPKSFMFMSALANACPNKSIFVGEDSDEVKAATDIGIAAFNTELERSLPTLVQIERLLNEEFHFQNPQDCGFDQLLNEQLDPQDIGLSLS